MTPARGASDGASVRLYLPQDAAPAAREAADRLRGALDDVEGEVAPTVVALGGNSAVLRALHETPEAFAVFGLSLGEADFLTNGWDDGDLSRRLRRAEPVGVRPLRLLCRTRGGEVRELLAFNDVAVFRASGRSARIAVRVDGRVRVADLLGDGMVISTPMGSTAYNRSARGPILPLDSHALALTPVAPSRPLWSGAVLRERARIALEVLEPDIRPVRLIADFREVRDVVAVNVALLPERRRTLLFDPGAGLRERQLSEQF